MAEILKNSSGLSGEYFVAEELLRGGFSVGITLDNAKAIDIFLERNGKQFFIQVKSIYKKKNVGWPILKDKIIPKHYYVFVNLNGDKMTYPDYYICKGKEAILVAKQYTSRGIINLNSLSVAIRSYGIK